MTTSQKIAYGFFAQTVILLMLYAAAALLTAVKFLTPDDPLALSLPYQQISGMAAVLLDLAALTGLLGGGVYVAVAQQTNYQVADERLLRNGFRLWTLLLAAATAAGLLGLLDARPLLELPPFLRIAQVLFVLLLAVNVLRSAANSPVLRVWAAGTGVFVIAGMIALIPAGDYVTEKMLRALAVGLRLNVAYPLAAFALGYWLLRRFSRIAPEWADIGIYTVGGLVTSAGVLTTLSGLQLLGAPDWARTMGNMAVIIIPACYLIVASHCYAALADRSADKGFSAHWFALSLLLFLLGIGLLGAVNAAPGAAQWTSGTRLSDLQATLTLLAVAAMGLGVVNQGSAELYNQDRRIAGLIPFWLVAFGVLGSGLALALAGVVQVFTERRLSIGYLDVQTLIAPLYGLWTFGLLLLALGAGIYALAFYARRPKGET